jgi:hypothetical protein
MEIVDKNIQANKASGSCIGKKNYTIFPFLSPPSLQAIFQVH